MSRAFNADRVGLRRRPGLLETFASILAFDARELPVQAERRPATIRSWPPRSFTVETSVKPAVSM